MAAASDMMVHSVLEDKVWTNYHKETWIFTQGRTDVREEATATDDDDGGGGALESRQTEVTEVIGNNSLQSPARNQVIAATCLCVAVKENEGTRRTATSPKSHV